ncbi:MAG: globin [Phycisphaerales bacterium]|nr:globin [Phycisphaerales bacterium]
MNTTDHDGGAQLDVRSIYGRIGSEAFWKIARAFYARIDRDAQLRGMFPADLEEPIRNQAEFLMQYFGGPETYSARKGHPRLRMRHHPFSIGVAERNAWVAAMDGALADAEIPDPDRTVMKKYFATTATFLMNRDEPI